jgi:hypothetical protein
MHASDGNGTRMELRLGLKTIAICVGLAATFFSVLLYIFTPRTEAQLTHSEFSHGLEMQTEKCKAKSELQAQTNERILEALHATTATVKTIDTNQREVLRTLGVRAGRIKALPAAMRDYDFGTLDEEP